MGVFDLRLAWWQTRGQAKRAWLFVFCVAVGVAARVAVGSFMGQLDQALSRQARQLLMADVEISSRTPLSEEKYHQLKQMLPEGGRMQDLLSFVTMVSAPASGLSRLVELNAVESEYPFYGQLRLSDQDETQIRSVGHSNLAGLEKLFTPKPQTYVQSELLLQLGIQIGDILRIGKTEFKVVGTILQEPGPGTRIFSLGPRVLIGLPHIPQTGLVGFGSRVQYMTLLALPDLSLAEPFAQRLREAWQLDSDRSRSRSLMGPELSIQVRSYKDSQGEIRRAFNQFADYLRLASLMALLVGGIGIASIVQGFIRDHLESIAILRTLGASGNRILRIYFIQCLGLGMAGSLLGILLGSFIQNLVSVLFKDLLPVSLSLGWNLGAAAWGLGLGLGTSAYFTFLPLLEVRNVKPLALFRGDLIKEQRGKGKGESIFSFPLSPFPFPLSLGALIFTLLAAVEARSLTLGPFFVAILLAGGLLLYTGGRLILPALSKIRPGRKIGASQAGFGIKHGLSNLNRPGLRPYPAVVALGLVAFILGMLSVYQFSLLKDLDPNQRIEELPNLFLIDIQRDQVVALEDLLRGRGIQEFILRPMVKARYRGLNGQAVKSEEALTREDESAQRMRNREQNLSYRFQLSEDETILKGRWMDPNSQEVEASLEEGFADRLGADIGDVLTFDVQGVEIKAKVTSIRKIRWMSFRPNFFILISPHAIEDAPQTWVGSISGLDKSTQDLVQTEIVQAFPNITLFDLAQTVQKVLKIMDQIIWAIRFLAVFSLGAGLVILVGIALSTARQRQMDAVLLKVLGAGRKTILTSVATEFGLFGIVSGLAGLILAIGFGWILLSGFLEISFAIPWHQLTVIFVGLIILCILTGMLACRRVFQAKPLEVLREG